MNDRWYNIFHIAALALPTLAVVWQYINQKKTADSLEKIKSDYLQKNSRLQLELDVAKDRSSKNYTESQQALIKFYGEATKLYWHMLGTYFDDGEIAVSTMIVSFDREMHKMINDFNVSLALLQLLFEDDKTNFLAGELHSALTNMKAAMSNYLDVMSKIIELQDSAQADADNLNESVKYELDALKNLGGEEDPNQVDEMLNKVLEVQAKVEHLIASRDGVVETIAAAQDTLAKSKEVLLPLIKKNREAFLHHTRQYLHNKKGA